MTTETSRLEGLTTATSYKAPVRLATTANITLAGLQTIDGVVLEEDDRILVKDQTDQSQNGIYNATTGTWSRTTDFNGARDARKGTQVKATDGSTNGGVIFELTTNNPITIGTSNLTFTNEAIGSFDSISPMNSVGDIIYGGASGTGTALDGNTTTTKKYLSQTGDGVNSSAPTWEQVSYNDLSDTPTLETSPTTTEGDVIVRGASADERLGIGSDGQVLSVVSGEVAWAAVGAGGNDFNDNVFRVSDSDDTTRKIAFDAQDVSAGSVRTFRVPNQNDTLVGANSTQTLTNKTLTAPVMSSISNSGTITIPTTTTTLVGRNTTDTLTNKTLNSPTVTGGNINADTLQSGGVDVLTDITGENIGDLSDVTITSVSDGEALTYDSVTGGWINSTVSGSGETNTMSNVGAGAGVFNNKDGVDFELNTIVAGPNITVTGGDGTGDISIEGAAAAGEANTASNVGTGSGIFKTKDGDDLEFRSLVAGANTTITGGTDEITITSGAGGSGDLWSDAVDSNIIPDTDSSREIGSSTNKFSRMYWDRFTMGDEGGEGGITSYRNAQMTPWDAVGYIDYQADPHCIDLGQYEVNLSNEPNLFAHAVGIRNSGTNCATVAQGGYAYSATTDVWGGNFTAGVEAGASSITAIGTEINVQMLSSNASTAAFGCVIASAGNNPTRGAAIQAQANTNAAQWAYGLRFTNGKSDESITATGFTEAFIASDSFTTAYGPTHGIDFKSVGFGTAAINIENCSGTYGVRVTGSQTVGYEAGGSGTFGFRAVSGSSYTHGFDADNTGNGFRAQGSGSHAFFVDSGGSYTNGLYMVGATFTGGYEIRTDGFEVTNTGAVGFPNISVEGSAGSLAGYVRHAYNGTVYKLAVYNL